MNVAKKYTFLIQGYGARLIASDWTSVSLTCALVFCVLQTRSSISGCVAVRLPMLLCAPQRGHPASALCLAQEMVIIGRKVGLIFVSTFFAHSSDIQSLMAILLVSRSIFCLLPRSGFRVALTGISAGSHDLLEFSPQVTIALCTHIFSRPFKDDSMDLFEVLSLTSTWTTFFCGTHPIRFRLLSCISALLSILGLFRVSKS